MARARLTADYNAQIEELKRKQAEQLRKLQERGKRIKQAKRSQGASLLERTGASELHPEAQVGALLEIVDRARSDPRLVERWKARGAEFLRREREQHAAAAGAASSGPGARAGLAAVPSADQPADQGGDAGAAPRAA